MRKLGLSLAAILCMAFLASSAFAASLYNAGDKYAGILYDTSTITFPTPPNWTNPGFGVKVGYFITDSIDINASYLFTNWSQPGFTGSSNAIDAMLDYHYALSDKMGVFAGIGYMSLTFNPPSGASFVGGGNVTGGALAYEAGLESRMGNIAAYVLYRGASPTLGTPALTLSTTVSGFEVGANFLF